MDTYTMHIGLKQELDKTAALELPAFEPEELSLWLTNTIRKFAKTRYSGINSKSQGFEETQKRIDDLRTLITNATISTITEASRIINGQRFDLPTDYWFSLEETVQAYISDPAEVLAWGVTECTWDEINQKIIDPFSEHILHYNVARPLRLFQGSTIEIIGDGNYTVSSVLLTYLKKPQAVNITNVASTFLVVGTTYGVYSASSIAYVTYNGNTYYTGETFKCVTGVLTYSESGTCDVMASCDLPEHTHDEIVKMAANSMLENIEQPRYRTHTAEVTTME